VTEVAKTSDFGTSSQPLLAASRITDLQTFVQEGFRNLRVEPATGGEKPGAASRGDGEVSEKSHEKTDQGAVDSIPEAHT
jgi:hypothetical protein